MKYTDNTFRNNFSRETLDCIKNAFYSNIVKSRRELDLAIMMKLDMGVIQGVIWLMDWAIRLRKQK
jgi:hypothetical protein